MMTLQLVADDMRESAEMTAEFDLRHDVFSLEMTHRGLEAARGAEGTKADWMLPLLQMPVIDGFHFLSYLLNRRAELPVEVRNAASAGTVWRYFPRSSQQGASSRAACLQTLSAYVRNSLSALGNERRYGVTLLDFFWFCIEEGQTLVAEVKAGGRTALVHVLRGKVIHASCEGDEGEAVFLKVMSWRAPSLQICPVMPSLHTSIHTSMGLLLTLANAVYVACIKSASTTIPETPGRQNPPQAGAATMERAPSPAATERGWRGALGRWLRSWWKQKLYSTSS